MQIEYFIDIICSLLLFNFVRNILLHSQSSVQVSNAVPHNKPSVRTFETIKSIGILQKTFLLLSRVESTFPA